MSIFLGAVKSVKESPYQIYLGSDIIYTNLNSQRLKSVLHSIKYELKYDLEDFLVTKNNKNVKTANELKFKLYYVKPFDNIESLKRKIREIEIKNN